MLFILWICSKCILSKYIMICIIIDDNELNKNNNSIFLIFILFLIIIYEYLIKFIILFL